MSSCNDMAGPKGVKLPFKVYGTASSKKTKGLLVPEPIIVEQKLGSLKCASTQCKDALDNIDEVNRREAEFQIRSNSGDYRHKFIPYSNCLDDNCLFHEEQKCGVLISMPNHSRHRSIAHWTECCNREQCVYHSREQELDKHINV